MFVWDVGYNTQSSLLIVLTDGTDVSVYLYPPSSFEHLVKLDQLNQVVINNRL